MSNSTDLLQGLLVARELSRRAYELHTEIRVLTHLCCHEPADLLVGAAQSLGPTTTSRKNNYRQKEERDEVEKTLW